MKWKLGPAASEEGETDPWNNSEMTFIAGTWWTGQQIRRPLPISLLMCFMEKSNPPGCNFCPPLIGALKQAPHSISLTAHRDPHLSRDISPPKRGPTCLSYCEAIVSPKGACFGAEHGGRYLFPCKPSPGSWKFMRVGGHRHESGASIFVLESPWPFLQRSFCLTLSEAPLQLTSWCLPPFYQKSFSNTTQTTLFSTKYLHESTSPQFPFMVSQWGSSQVSLYTVLFEGIPLFLISSNHTDSVLPP